MIPILLHGATGRMGRAIRASLPEAADVSLVACVSPEGEAEADDRSGSEWVRADRLGERLATNSWPGDLVVIDVSLAAGTRDLLGVLEREPRRLVAATTGLGPEDEARIEALAKRTAVLRAPNLSLGIAVIRRWLEDSAAALRAAYSLDIVEHHHAGKRDAPSGTALALAGAWRGSAEATTREPAFHSIRGGTVPGIHRIVLSGVGETLEVVHTIFDRAVFARGAVQAARYLHGKPAGRYTVDQILEATE